MGSKRSGARSRITLQQILAAALCGAILAIGSAPCSRAQSRANLLQPIGRFAENYVTTPKISGNNLVGLRWLTQDRRFDLDSVHIIVAQPQSIGRVCVEIVSKDGRYTSDNIYDLSRSGTPAPGFDLPTNFKSELTAYSTDDLSVIVRKAPCDTGQLTPIIPAFLGTDPAERPQSSELRAFVNADPARIAMIVIDGVGQTIANGQCGVAGSGVRIAYAAECAIRVPITLKGDYKLRLTQKERFKTVYTDYPIVLP